MIHLKEMKTDYKFPLLAKFNDLDRKHELLIIGSNMEAVIINTVTGDVKSWGPCNPFDDKSAHLYNILHNGSSLTIINQTLKEAQS